MNDPFVLALIERQEAEGLSLRAFADKVGVSPSLWSRTRAGERGAGGPLIRGALAIYPDLAPLLAQAVTIGTENGAD